MKRAVSVLAVLALALATTMAQARPAAKGVAKHAASQGHRVLVKATKAKSAKHPLANNSAHKPTHKPTHKPAHKSAHKPTHKPAHKSAHKPAH